MSGPRHPDFEPGNTIALKHGANSPRAVAERAELVRPRLFEVCPWLHTTHDVLAVDRFLRAEARALILHEYIAGICDGPGVPPRCPSGSGSRRRRPTTSPHGWATPSDSIPAAVHGCSRRLRPPRRPWPT